MKLALINCYFGELPNYFELWLQSCGANPDIDFYFLTNAEVPYEIPGNVFVFHISWEKIVKQIDEKFDFKTEIKSPYKLTDFKPAYGYIFEDLLESYDYWGYCDIDLIFGNLMKFIKEPMEKGIDKLYRLGHLTIYRNTNEMRNLFRQRGAPFSYREVFSNPEFYSFDEHSGQMTIAKQQDVSEYYREDMADISCRIRRMTASRHENYSYQVFYYENGAIWRAFIKDGRTEYEEFAYIHLQKRRYMRFDKTDCFYILSDHFQNKTAGIPHEEEIKKLSEFVGNKQDKKQLNIFRTKKIKQFLVCSIKEKYIWIKIKLAENRY